MSHSTLANTSWEFPATGFAPTDIDAALTFQSAGNTYTSIYTLETLTEHPALSYGQTTGTTVWYEGWVSDDYRTVDITGGTDATDADAIAWFEAMATEIPTPAQRTVYTTTGKELQDIADAIRTMGMTSAPLEYPDDFIDAIYALPHWAEIAAVIVGSGSGSAWTTVGSSSTAATIVQANHDFFNDSSGVFTCLKAGTYIIDYYVRGAYNTSGTAINAYFRIYQNSNIIDSVESGTTYRNTGGTGTVMATLASGDTLYAQQRGSSGTTATTFGMIVKATPI